MEAATECDGIRRSRSYALVGRALGRLCRRPLLEQIGVIGHGLLAKRREQFLHRAHHSRIERAFLLQAGGQGCPEALLLRAALVAQYRRELPRRGTLVELGEGLLGDALAHQPGRAIENAALVLRLRPGCQAPTHEHDDRNKHVDLARYVPEPGPPWKFAPAVLVPACAGFFLPARPRARPPAGRRRAPLASGGLRRNRPNHIQNGPGPADARTPSAVEPRDACPQGGG